MAFSPETYALLKGLLDTESADVDDLKTRTTDIETALTTKVGFVKENLSASTVTNITNVYEAATNLTFVSSCHTSTTGLQGLIGFKRTATPVEKFIYVVAGSGGMSLGIVVINHGESDTYSFYRFVFED